MSYKERFVKLYKEGKLDEITMIKMAAFSEELEKISAGDLSRWAPAFAAGAAGILTSLVGPVVDSFIDNKMGRDIGNQGDNVFETLYRTSPDINKYNKETARQFYNSLMHHSPKLAVDPVSAKSYLINMLVWNDSNTGVPVNLFSELNKIPALGNSRFTGIDLKSPLMDTTKGILGQVQRDQEAQREANKFATTNKTSYDFT